MSIPKTPIKYRELCEEFEDQAGNPLKAYDISRDLTEFYDMKRRQSLCKHGKQKVTHEWGTKYNSFVKYETDYCPKCGADLTKGATHAS